MLKYITITGADNDVLPEELVKLSKKFSFVEWGILFSPAKQGQLRYPSDNWVDSLREVSDKIRISTHLCGGWVRDIVAGEFIFANACNGFVNVAKRIQLNMTDATFMSLDLEKTKSCIGNKFKENAPTVILQTRRRFERYEEARKLGFDMLFDVSGGKGLEPKEWAVPVDGVFCGYAGGLKPDNLKENLDKISNLVGDFDFWVDMETGVRKDNRFDLEKVEKCLEIANKYR